MSAFDDLQWRGLVYDSTEGAREHLGQNPSKVYIGFDPTAPSLHVGSLLPLMTLARMQRFGHSPILLMGGGTGLIGDPSGKTLERQLLTKEKVAENLAQIRQQVEPLFDFESPSNPATTVNNADWLTTLSMVDFLRDVGKHFRVNVMLQRESVKRRLEQEEGISYTEFSYMLLQAYDFYVLERDHGVTVQMGGSDQWGNIVAGSDLIRRLGRGPAHGVVFPLVTSSSGVKFGKTEAGAVWLDPELTSPYRFYQFWLNTTDEDVVKYLRYFTWLDQEEIDGLGEDLRDNPAARAPQRRLAAEVTGMLHGTDALARAERSSQVLFGGDLGDLETRDIHEIFDDVPSSVVAPERFDGDGMALVELLADCGLAPSRGAAKRLVRDGGAYLNNRRCGDERAKITRQDFIDGSVLVLRKGQKKYHLVTLPGETA